MSAPRMRFQDIQATIKGRQQRLRVIGRLGHGVLIWVCFGKMAFPTRDHALALFREIVPHVLCPPES